MKDSMTCMRLFLLLVVCLATVERFKASNAKDQDCSWTVWALNKLSEGIGLVKTKNVAQIVMEKTSDAASRSTDALNSAAYETSKYASDIAGSTSDRVGNAKEWASPSGANEEHNNNAYESASGQAHILMKTTSDKARSMAKDAYNKVACDSALDLAEDAKHKTYKAYATGSDKAKERASDTYNEASQSYGNAKSKLDDAYALAKASMSEQDKQRYEEAKEKASQAVGDFGDHKMRGVSTANM